MGIVEVGITVTGMVFLAKYQSDGTINWVKQTQSSPTAVDELHSVAIGLDGNIL